MAWVLSFTLFLSTATCAFSAPLGQRNETRYAPVKTLQGQFEFYVEESTVDEMKEMKESIKEELGDVKKYIEHLVSTSIVDLTKHVATQAEEIEELEINVKALRESLADKLDENDRKIAWAITDGSLAPRNTSWVQENFREQRHLLDQVLSTLRMQENITKQYYSDVLVIRHCGNALTSGVTTITPIDDQPSFLVMCLVRESGNWMVFQRRYNGSLDFYRDWEDYAHGFGNVDGEHWLGLRHLRVLSSLYNLELRVEMTSYEEAEKSYYAQYSSFGVASEEDHFRLTIGGNSGNAGDSLIDSHNGRPFSTRDRDNGGNGCSVKRHGAWWYNKCGDSNLNGDYTTNTAGVNSYYQHLFWKSLKSKKDYALKATTMMVRIK